MKKQAEHDELLGQRLLTGNDQRNLLRHGRSQLIRSVASIVTLELGEVFVLQHKSARCVVGSVDVGREKILSIFCPSVSVGAEHLVNRCSVFCSAEESVLISIDVM